MKLIAGGRDDDPNVWYFVTRENSSTVWLSQRYDEARTQAKQLADKERVVTTIWKGQALEDYRPVGAEGHPREAEA